jgi:hypothetical protein
MTTSENVERIRKHYRLKLIAGRFVSYPFVSEELASLIAEAEGMALDDSEIEVSLERPDKDRVRIRRVFSLENVIANIRQKHSKREFYDSDIIQLHTFGWTVTRVNTLQNDEFSGSLNFHAYR